MLLCSNLFFFPCVFFSLSLSLSVSLSVFSHSHCSIHYAIKRLRGLRNELGDLKKLANIIQLFSELGGYIVFLSEKVIADDQTSNGVSCDRERVKVLRRRRYWVSSFTRRDSIVRCLKRLSN